MEEERKKREQEEYEALKSAFTVEGEGFEEDEEQDSDSLLKDFIDYIKVRIKIRCSQSHIIYSILFLKTETVPYAENNFS